jgi:hypothetical protein
VTEPMMHPTAERLQAFAEKTLEAGERVVVESHLLGCSQCQSDVEEWRALFVALSGLPRFAPSSGFANRVIAGLALPDPWYARLGSYLQRLVPRTTKGWALASACFALPLTLTAGLLWWLLSKPYITPSRLWTFAVDQGAHLVDAVAAWVVPTVMQSDVALFIARALESVAGGGLRTAGAFAGLASITVAVSAWILYQYLFRAPARGSHYVTYSF